jgi:PhzF family phenazine biosynthesis protein
LQQKFLIGEKMISFYHVDAFTDELFRGNPAGVCLLQEWLSNELLQAIAVESNLPVTAFVLNEKGKYSIRWFTPEYELDLCGHGTMAASQVIFQCLSPQLSQIDFYSQAGILKVKREGEMAILNFPAKKMITCASPALLVEGLGQAPVEVYDGQGERYIAVFDSEDQIKAMKPNMQLLSQLSHRSVVITARSNEFDFVSRVFYPKKTSATEDAVTGAAHCFLVPYWAHKLNKNSLHAKQVSSRGGELFCQLEHDRVLIGGRGRLYMKGEIQE